MGDSEWGNLIMEGLVSRRMAKKELGGMSALMLSSGKNPINVACGWMDVFTVSE